MGLSFVSSSRRRHGLPFPLLCRHLPCTVSSSCLRPASASVSSLEGKLVVSTAALMETPAGAELWGDQSHLGGCLGVGHPSPPFTVHLSARDVPNCDTRSLCAACLPGVVGGVANSAPQLLCLSLRGVKRSDRGRSAQRASVAREWSSFLAWPCGSRAVRSVSVPPRASSESGSRSVSVLPPEPLCSLSRAQFVKSTD